MCLFGLNCVIHNMVMPLTQWCRHGILEHGNISDICSLVAIFDVANDVA